MEAMKSDVDEVALQGIEFWSNVCDEEVDLVIEASEAQEQGRLPERTSRFYAKGALQYLVPVLTKSLTKQVRQHNEESGGRWREIPVFVCLLPVWYLLCDDWWGRDRCGYGLSQWKTPLHCNGVSHWLHPYPEWSLWWWCGEVLGDGADLGRGLAYD